MIFKILRISFVSMALALLLTACGGSTNSFTWQVDSLPTNLDPQVASESSDVTACLNLYSGLFRLDENGTPQPDTCERYEISADELTYTFYLKSGLTYTGYRGSSTGTAVTAHDFAFGLYRVFLPETGSPYAEALSCIAGSAKVQQGGSQSALGVSAPNDTTLIITLSRRDSDFLSKLCLPGAMPCNQAFFESTGGSYALSSAMTISNGPFYLYNWTESGLFLRRKADGDLVDAVRIVLDSNNSAADEVLTPAEKIENEKADAILYSSGDDTGLPSIQYQGETWCLILNTQNTSLSNLSLRQALAQVAYSAEPATDNGSISADGLIPPAVTVGGSGYREQAGSTLPAEQNAASLYRTALAELNTGSIRGITVTVPQSNSSIAAAFDQLNQQWQSELGLYFNVQQLSDEDLQAALNIGDYSIILVPLSVGENSPAAWLQLFGSGDLGAWQSYSYAHAAAALDPNDSDYLQQCVSLEQSLLEQCVVIPLFFQTQQLLLSPKVDRVVFDSFGPTVDLTWATKQ